MTPHAPDPSQSLIAIYKATPESVALARSALRVLVNDVGADAETSARVLLAASEALTNVVGHAYRESPQGGNISLAAHRIDDELWVVVSDRGSGLRVGSQRSLGLGLGLGVITSVSDEVDILEPAEGGVELRMRFQLDARAA